MSIQGAQGKAMAKPIKNIADHSDQERQPVPFRVGVTTKSNMRSATTPLSGPFVPIKKAIRGKVNDVDA